MTPSFRVNASSHLDRPCSLVFFVCAASFALFASGCAAFGSVPPPAPASSAEAARDGLARVQREGVLRWGADRQGGKPYVYEDPDHAGEVRGFEVDLANALARELGVRAELVQNDWSALVPSLERGTFDVILNGLEVTPARVGRVRFTRPYYVFAARLMARKDDARLQGDDLGKLVASGLGAMRVGTLTASLSEDLLRKSGVTQIVTYEGQEEPYLDLSAGRTDAVLLDDVIASRYGEIRPDLRVVGDVGEGYYAIGVRPAEPALARALDEAIGSLTRSGELSKILAKEQLGNARQTKIVQWDEAAQQRLEGKKPNETTVSLRRTMSRAQVLSFFEAAAWTLFISASAMMLAVPLGLGLALLRSYGPRFLARLATVYVELYRGTPVLLQLYVLYYGLADYVKLSAPLAAIIGLGMNYAAYEAEVYRAGIEAVPKGQLEAAYALGMDTPLALRRVVLPQALRLALPAVTNDFIALLKDSSLVSIITVVELTKRMTIVAVDTRSYVLPGLLCASLYFAMSYPLSLLAKRLGERLARS